MKNFDLAIIGSGPAGQRAAIQGAKYGKRVALIEKESVYGGACIHTGTLPSKALRESIYNIYTFRLGGTEFTRKAVSQRVTFKELSARKDKVVAQENEMIARQIRSNGISVYNGFGSLLDTHRIRIESSEGGEIVISADHIIIATGSRPVRPAKIPFNDKTICDSDSILNMDETPDSLTVVGGGVIGCEYASMFAALGVDVHLVDKKDDILPFIDQEITEVLKKALVSQGCRLHLGDEFVEIRKAKDGQVETVLKSGKILKTGALLYAMGRDAQTAKLGLDNVGVKPDARGLLTVNEFYQTTAENIYAVGDVIGFPSLASSAFEQGRLAVCNAFKIIHTGFPETFPYGIYTIPEISSVGKTEEQLLADGTEFEVGRAEYEETARGNIIADSVGLLKICFCPKSYRIHGIHVIGASASELIHLGQMVMALGGDMMSFVSNIFNYPTLAETYKIAAFNGLNKVFKSKEIRY
jgi:NAD(P) transhydrogenase